MAASMVGVAVTTLATVASAMRTACPCTLTGTWHGHPSGKIDPTPISVVQRAPLSFSADGKPGVVASDCRTVAWSGLNGTLHANTPANASAPSCTRIDWKNPGKTWWCREPYCEWVPPPLPPPSPAPPPPPPPNVTLPNIVFILTDDLDAELGSTTYMPTLQRELVDKGTSFTAFYVTTPVCCPSRTSFLTGRYAHNNGAMGIVRGQRAPGGWCGEGYFWKGPLQHQSVATYMKAAGYTTGIFGKELNVVDTTYVSPGWDRYFVVEDECNYFGNRFADNGRLTQVGSETYMTTAIQNTSLEWIRSNRRTPVRPFPFFLYIGVHAPHQPATPDVKYESLFPNVTAPRTPAWNMSAADHHWLVSMQQPLATLDVRESDEMYRRRLRSLQSVDDLIGALLETLDEIGELDRTFVLFSSDHGYHFGQWRIPAHKELAYETDLRVPFVVRGPGIRQSVIVDAIGLNIDLAPTIADLAGFTIPEAARVDGRSLKPFLLGLNSGINGRQEFLFEHEGNNIQPFRGSDANHCTLRWMLPTGGAPENPTVPGLCSCGNPMQHWISSSNNTYKGLRVRNASMDYKLVRYDDAVDFHELFDLNTDPHELKNVISSAPRDVVGYMQARLAELRGCGANSGAHESPSTLCP